MLAVSLLIFIKHLQSETSPEYSNTVTVEPHMSAVENINACIMYCALNRMYIVVIVGGVVGISLHLLPLPCLGFLAVVWGECNHSFHNCCMSLWVKQNNRCPLCQQDWVVQRIGK